MGRGKVEILFVNLNGKVWIQRTPLFVEIAAITFFRFIIDVMERKVILLKNSIQGLLNFV